VCVSQCVCLSLSGCLSLCVCLSKCVCLSLTVYVSQCFFVTDPMKLMPRPLHSKPAELEVYGNNWSPSREIKTEKSLNCSKIWEKFKARQMQEK